MGLDGQVGFDRQRWELRRHSQPNRESKAPRGSVQWELGWPSQGASGMFRKVAGDEAGKGA